MKQYKKIQTSKDYYINFIKNVARLGTGSALVLLHFAVSAGASILSRRSKKSSPTALLPYEK